MKKRSLYDFVRARSELLDSMLGQKVSVLDDGFVRVVDYMGDDSSVVQAARVSYGAGTKRISEDRGLIRYLMRNGHSTPFEMCELKLHVRAPMDVWRQWIRHRTASVNEYSTRYSFAIDSAQRTAPSEWRSQSSQNRQGSQGYLDIQEGQELSVEEEKLQVAARAEYERRVHMGVAREQARKDLPLSTYTEAYWKIDLHNLLHFLTLRMDSHAQSEIRQYATLIGEQIVSAWVPHTWEAFVDFRLKSLVLTGLEVQIVSALVSGDLSGARFVAQQNGLLVDAGAGKLVMNRERTELEQKLRSLGFVIPWSSDVTYE